MGKKKKVEQQDLGALLTDYDDFSSVVSATGFTGLTQTPPLSDAEAESYSELWNYPKPENTPQMEQKKEP